MYNPVWASTWQRLCWDLLEAQHHPPGGDLHGEHRTAGVEAPGHTPGTPMAPEGALSPLKKTAAESRAVISGTARNIPTL